MSLRDRWDLLGRLAALIFVVLAIVAFVPYLQERWANDDFLATSERVMAEILAGGRCGYDPDVDYIVGYEFDDEIYESRINRVSGFWDLQRGRQRQDCQFDVFERSDITSGEAELREIEVIVDPGDPSFVRLSDQRNISHRARLIRTLAWPSLFAALAAATAAARRRQTLHRRSRSKSRRSSR